MQKEGTVHQCQELNYDQEGITELTHEHKSFSPLCKTASLRLGEAPKLQPKPETKGNHIYFRIFCLRFE